MTVTARTAGPLRRGLYGLLVGGLLSTTSAAIALPVANAAPQECNSTVGQSVSQTVQSYLDRHPDVKQELTSRAEAESPGSDNALLDYLNRHPDVQQALITLANQCMP